MPPRIGILDGYVDEPATFGVPPYIGPHVRYLAGATWDATDGQAEVRYATIDQFRQGHRDVLDADILVLVSGALVPGVYLRGRPINYREAVEIAASFGGPVVLAGSSAIYGFGQGGGRPTAGRLELKDRFTVVARRHPDATLYDLLTRQEATIRNRTMDEWRRWSIRGAPIVRQHPDWPAPLIAELETYYGCVRYAVGGCSFCMEPAEGRPDYRPVEHVLDEVSALARQGVVHYRLGGQACFYSYQATGLGNTPTPRPQPDAIRRLLIGIHQRCPALRVLHIDNADPAVISAHEKEAREITRLLARYATPGNIAAFGLETADPAVFEANNLNATTDICLHAMRILNEEGGRRGWNGLPCILPGLNFLSGLKGETKETFRHNKRFLEAMLAEGLMVRRINIRKVVTTQDGFRVHEREHQAFKRWVRESVDAPMLNRIVPRGTVLRDVYLEMQHGHVTYGRQVGTYALLVGLPYDAPTDRFVDVLVTEHGQRSVTGVEIPMPVNHIQPRALEGLPGIGRKRAARIIRSRPYGRVHDVAKQLDEPSLGDSLARILTVRA